MDNYQCENCAVLIQSNSTPKTIGCPDAPFHKWSKLGPIGADNYQCKKCGTLVKMAKSPMTIGCPQASFHQWTKL